MNEDKNTAIRAALSQIEADHHVHILYACESGSRAWGFASTNSDYDVRFIYARHPQEYLRLDTPRDVIELPIKDDLDINGWDIFKALRLLRKSNPPLLEWLVSPIVYRGDDAPAIQALRNLARNGFSLATLRYHYWHMARGNWQQYLRRRDEVLLKKYLYVLRPLATLLYLEQYKTLPPVNFIDTLWAIQMDSKVLCHIIALIERKCAGEEMGMGAVDPVLHDFIDELMARPESTSLLTHYTDTENHIILEHDAKRCAALSQGCEEWLDKVLQAIAKGEPVK